MSLEEKFCAATTIVRKMPEAGPLVPTNDEKLTLYSLYKQATVGKNEEPQPSFFSFVERAKWDAWKKLGDMTQEEAKKKYIAALKMIIKKISSTIDVTEWLEKIDPELPEKFMLISPI